MDEKTIISNLKNISQNLDTVSPLIKNNEWGSVGQILSDVDRIQEQIKKNTPPIDTLLLQNPSFKEEYEPLKQIILTKTARIISEIEAWKMAHTEKISDSRTLIDNIAKYSKSPNTSFYIDTKE